MQGGARDTCPIAVSHEVVPTEHQSIDTQVFDERLKSGVFGHPIGFLSKEMQGTSVGG